MFGLEKLLVDFDIVHAGELFNYYTYQSVLAKNNNKKLKVVATVWENTFGRFEYNYWPGFKVPPRYWRDKLKKIMDANVQGVDMFLPVTTDSAEYLLDFGVPEEKIRVITPGVIKVEKKYKSEFPPELNEKEIYLMVNRLVREKGVYDVFYAWKIYLSKAQNSDKKVLVVVGGGPEYKNMKRLAGDLGLLGKSILFFSQIPYNDVLRLYEKAKCLLLGSMSTTTWQEQFGYVLAEAICADVPIISTYSGAIPLVVGEAGILTSPAHPIEMSRALLEIDKSDIYARLKEGCRKEKKKFEVEEYVRQVADVYKKLAGI